MHQLDSLTRSMGRRSLLKSNGAGPLPELLMCLCLVAPDSAAGSCLAVTGVTAWGRICCTASMGSGVHGFAAVSTPD